MPYKNIMFIKLEKRLLNDARWYMLSEPAQLIYIKLILLAAETYNRVPKNLTALRKAFKTDLTETEIDLSIKEIRKAFPKFKQNRYVYYFLGFEEKTNYINRWIVSGKSQGNPKVSVDKDIDKEEDKEEDKEYIADTKSAHKLVKKKIKNVDPLLKSVITHICDSWEKKKGIKYIFNGKNAKQIQRLCNAYDHQSIMALWDLYLSRDDEFIIRCGHSIGCFVTSMPSLVDMPYKTLSKKYEMKLYPELLSINKTVANLNVNIKGVKK